MPHSLWSGAEIALLALLIGPANLSSCCILFLHPQMPLLDVQCKNGVPTTDLTLEEEDQEGEKIDGCNDSEWENTLLSILRRHVRKGYEREAERMY
jgi:hypothetical protein